MKRLRTYLIRYWGFLALAIAIGGLVTGIKGTIILLLCGAALVYVLFQARVWCGAVTREHQLCRNNAQGLLGGCNQYRQHKWQKLKMLIAPREWRELARSLSAPYADVFEVEGERVSRPSACTSTRSSCLLNSG